MGYKIYSLNELSCLQALMSYMQPCAHVDAHLGG